MQVHQQDSQLKEIRLVHVNVHLPYEVIISTSVTCMTFAVHVQHNNIVS